MSKTVLYVAEVFMLSVHAPFLSLPRFTYMHRMHCQVGLGRVLLCTKSGLSKSPERRSDRCRRFRIYRKTRCLSRSDLLRLTVLSRHITAPRTMDQSSGLPQPTTPAAPLTVANANEGTSPTDESAKRKRQPRNSACQPCAQLKMKCVPSAVAGKCERLVTYQHF